MIKKYKSLFKLLAFLSLVLACFLTTIDLNKTQVLSKISAEKLESELQEVTDIYEDSLIPYTSFEDLNFIKSSKHLYSLCYLRINANRVKEINTCLAISERGPPIA